MKECKWVTGEFEELCVNPDCWNCNYFCRYEDCEVSTRVITAKEGAVEEWNRRVNETD